MYLWSIDSGSMKDLQTLSAEYIDSANLWFFFKYLHWIEENNRVPTEKPKMGFWRVYAQPQVVQNTVEKKNSVQSHVKVGMCKCRGKIYLKKS